MNKNSSSPFPPSDDAGSMPSVPISINSERTTPYVPISVEDPGTILPFSNSTESMEQMQLVRDINYNSNWVGRIQQEMLQVSSLFRGISTSGASHPSASAGPNLHEMRQKSTQCRLLREADCRLLHEPMDLPVYKDVSDTVKINTKLKNSPEKKKVVHHVRSDSNRITAARSTQCSKVEQVRHTKKLLKETSTIQQFRNKSLVAGVPPLQNIKKSIQCSLRVGSQSKDSYVPGKSRSVSLVVSDQTPQKTEKSIQCDDLLSRDTTKCEGETEHENREQSRVPHVHPKIDETLYKVMTVSSSHQVQSKVTAKPVTMNANEEMCFDRNRNTIRNGKDLNKM